MVAHIIKKIVDQLKAFVIRVQAFVVIGFRQSLRVKFTFIVWLLPIILLPLIFVVKTDTAKCLYAVLIMAIFWMTEVLPIPVTSMMPLFLFPMSGILPAKTVAERYFQDPTFLFMGGFLVAISIEQSKFHLRIALRALMLVGSNPKWVMLSLMLICGFMSMWLSNSATTVMMLPTVEAILTEIIKNKRCQQDDTNLKSADSKQNDISCTIEKGNSVKKSNEEFKLEKNSLSVEELNLCKMFFLSVCYSSSIGGISTLTGTATNIIVAGMIESKYGSNTGVSFASWMAFAFPLALLNLLMAWILLQFSFIGVRQTLTNACKKSKDSKVKNVIKQRYDALGPINFSQKLLAVMFSLLVLLWIFRDPQYIPGWASLFRKKYVSDATAVMFIAFILFILPVNWPNDFCKKNQKDIPSISHNSLLDWSLVMAKFPWGLILLFGASFSMASAIEASGLSKLLGDGLATFGSSLSPVSMCAITAIISTFATEFTSNMAIVSILAPIIGAVAENLEVNPLYFIFTVTVCVSYAFMLPIATPPNAIVFGYGYLRVVDMMKVGWFMNWLAIGLTFLSMHTWGLWIFKFNTYPSWAPLKNITLNFSEIFNSSSSIN